MKKVVLVFLSAALFFSCEERTNHVADTADVEYGDSNMNNSGVSYIDSAAFIPEKQKDADSISVTSKHLYCVKSSENNHFCLDIDLPVFDNGDIDRKILTWINNHLEETIEDTLNSNADKAVVDDFEAYKAKFNKKYDGDIFNLKAMAIFYRDKHFSLYSGSQLGIDYNISCKKIYESKDIVSFEINEYFGNYAIMQSKSTVKGATFFKYNGDQLTWAMFEDSNVKEVLKREVNNQYLKFPQEQYEEFLNTSKYREFTLPNNPPYMVKNGLKFVYMIHEMSEKENAGQINCIVPIENLKLNPSLTSLLK